ncbi:MAG: hypothetical protein JWQ33_2299, partial [Ramlibacter sp.]|nr:hypothetical protein [Ramlibacter sp.]
RDKDGRILEHGLHIWLGFYENAFRMMRECYAEVEKRQWGPNAAEGSRLAHGSMDEAFFPEPHIGVAVRDSTEGSSPDPARKWAIWSGYLPPAKGMPGEALDTDSNPFTLSNYLIRCYELLKTLMLSEVGPVDGAEKRSALDAAIELDYAYNPLRTPAEILDWSARMLRGTVLTAAAIMLQAVLILEELLRTPAAAAPIANSRTVQLVTAILAQTRKLLSEVVAVDPVLRQKMEIIDIVISIAVGLYRNRVLFNDKGFDAINGFDYRQWLIAQGASPAAVNSGFITGIYDLTFAYEGGDRSRHQLAAGVALRGALRMFFTYRGSMFWRMRSGMGDAVFAPLYKVLLARGVQFHYLHTLDSVEMATVQGERYIKSLNFKTDGDAARLDALGHQALDHFGCWPDDKHLFEAARGSAQGAYAGRPVTDFDAVVLSMGADDFFEVGDRAGFLASLPPNWATMRRNVRTAATQSAQVWLARDLEQLGWRRGSGIMTALQGPFETWADMTHTLATEKAWRRAKGITESEHDKARSVAYFCAVLADGDAPRGSEAQARTAVEANLEQMLARGMKPFWPGAFDGKQTAWDLQVGAPHVQANVEGSDRYTLAAPGTIKYRISPLDRPVMNMTVAGDWTASGLDAGCVEAAVMSGMLAAFAISGKAAILDSIVGYDHP